MSVPYDFNGANLDAIEDDLAPLGGIEGARVLARELADTGEPGAVEGWQRITAALDVQRAALDAYRRLGVVDLAAWRRERAHLLALRRWAARKGRR